MKHPLKNIPFNTKRVFFATEALLFLVFVLFLLFFHSLSIKQQQQEFYHHGQSVANSIWDVNRVAAKEYLTIVCRLSNYSNLVVWDDAEREFATIENPLDAYTLPQLIKPIKLKTDISFQGQIVGTMTCDWHSRTMLVGAFALLILGLMSLSLWFFLHTVAHKRNLEIRIQERTNELQESQKRLKKSETKFRGLVEASYDWIWEIDRHGVYSYASPQVKEILGYNPEDIIGKSLFDLMSPEEEKTIAAVFNRSMKEKAPIIALENVNLHRDGHYVTLETSGVPFFDEKGNIAGYRGVDRDITKRKQSDEALRKSEEKYRGIFNESVAAIYVFDRDRKFIDSNQAGLDLLGYSREELLAMTISDAVIPAEDQFLDGDKIYNYEHQLIRRDGKVITVLNNSMPLTTAGGDVVGMQSTLFDITDRKKAEEKLKASEAFLDAIIENIPNMIFVKDAEELRFVRFNKAGEELIGFARKELLGKNDYDFFPREEADFFTAKDREVLHRGLLVDIPEESIQTKFKGDRILHTRKIPLSNKEGNTAYLLGISEDITEKKDLEEKLLQAQKMEAIGTLAGGIAHDFNNILSAIVGFAEFIAQESPADSEVADDAQQIINATNRASELVRQILTFSRQTDIKKDILRPHPIIKETLNMLRATLPASITIEENIDQECGAILANSTNIHQIVINLCTNARQAIADDKGMIRVELGRQEIDLNEIPVDQPAHPGEFVFLKVTDSGSGIKKEELSRVFEPYFSTKKPGEGTGLGLSVVHGIVRECSGFITLASELGKGTEISVYLPALDIPVDDQPEQLSNRVHDKKSIQGNILVVDDEPYLVRINKKRLEDCGYKVEAVTDSRKALDIFQSQPDNFDLLITDQTMPHFTGEELAKNVLKIKPSLPIIMCTGHSDIVSEKKALAMGITKFVLKPLQADELLDAVDEVLG